MYSLSEKQKVFPLLVARLIVDVNNLGYQTMLGEVERPPETARIYAAQEKGIIKSLHCINIALDLKLYKDGIYLTKSEQYLPAGELWESYSTPDYVCSWGGRFIHRPDGNHFSISHEGIR